MLHCEINSNLREKFITEYAIQISDLIITLTKLISVPL